MLYPDYIKIETVRLYRKTGDVNYVIAEMERQFNVTVSRRSIFNWAKRPELNTNDTNGTLALFAVEETPGKPEPRIKFDKEKFLRIYSRLFNEESQKVSPLIRKIISELSSPKRQEEIEKMKIADLARLYRDLTGTEMKQFDFVMRMMAADNDEDSIEDLLKVMEKKIDSIGDDNHEETRDCEIIPD